jgi:hypothetical protein
MVELRTNRIANKVLFVMYNTTFAQLKRTYEGASKRRITDAQFRKLIPTLPVVHVVEDGRRNKWIEKYTFNGK